MTLTRRHLVLASLAGPALHLAPAQAQAPYPQRPVRLVVPYAAGGGPDVLTRRLAERLGPLLGQTVFVENRVGAGGVVAAETVVQAEPDGYLLMLGASTHVTQKLLSPQVRFDPLTQFVHIVRTSISPSVLVVAADSPWRRLQDLLDAARQTPGRLNYASGGVGSAAHLAGAALVSAAQLQVTHIPYRGSVEIVPAILSGDTQFGFPVASTALPLVQQGKVRALAVTGDRRMTRLGAVPTLKEVLGRDDLVLDAWSGLWAPARTPAAIVARLNGAMQQVLAEPAIREAFDAAGAPVSPTRTPEEFTRFVLAETAKYARLVVSSRITVG